MGVKKFDVVKVVVVCIKVIMCCEIGNLIWFDDNVVVIINDDKNFKGICVFGLVVCELCECSFIKIVFFVLEVI